MQITFTAKDVTKYYSTDITVEGVNRRIPFTRKGGIPLAQFGTTDKKIIKALFAHPAFLTGKIVMDVAEDVVLRYLNNKEQVDYFTEEKLQSISSNGIVALGKLYNSPVKEVELIRYTLVNRAVSNEAQRIVEKYPLNEAPSVGDLVDEALENGYIVQKGRWWYVTDDTFPEGLMKLGGSRDEAEDWLEKNTDKYNAYLQANLELV